MSPWRDPGNMLPVRLHGAVGFLFRNVFFFLMLSSRHANRETHKTLVCYLNIFSLLACNIFWKQLILRNVNTHNENILYPTDG